MRTRIEIETSVSLDKIVREQAEHQVIEATILEVLLDIRELLTPKPECNCEGFMGHKVYQDKDT